MTSQYPRIGLQRDAVELACQSEYWIAYGTEKCRILQQACNGIDCDVQHVGSTSVPNLKAKPIIDIVIGLSDMTDFERVHTAICNLGYIYRGIGSGSNGHLFVLESKPDVRTEHLHVIPLGSEKWDTYILFRNALRNSSSLVAEYTILKESLLSCFSNNRKEYTAGKAQFIRNVLNAQR